MRFSVIIPVHNREDQLVRAIESVYAQTLKDYELIVVNDGSDEEYKDFYLKLQKKYGFILVHQENMGVSSARNHGIKLSQGEYIALLDSDDEWKDNKLETQDKYLKDTNYLWCHTNEVWIRNGIFVNQMKKHEKQGGDQLIRSFKMCLISPSSVVIKKALFNEIGYFNEEFIVCEDYDLWLRILSLYPIGYVEDALVTKFGGHDDQLSHRYKAMDYYRVKSLHNLFKSFPLSEDKKTKLVTVLTKKCKILLNGYKKYNNMKDYSEIEEIYKSYISNI